MNPLGQDIQTRQDQESCTRHARPYLWLVSYPKSGNTWVRIFFHAYECLLNNRPESFSLQNLSGNYLASRNLFEWVTGLDAGFMSPSAIAISRSHGLAVQAERNRSDRLEVFKIHDQFRRFDSQAALIPERYSRGVIYLVRNPVDIVASWAYHRQAELAETVAFMSDQNAWISLSMHRQTFNLPQWLGSWSSHVTSWTTLSTIPLKVLRYEDLLANPVHSFRKIVEFSGWAVDEKILQMAVEMTKFSTLKAVEKESGFRELPKRSAIPSFFRQGKSGAGRAELPPELLEIVLNDHREVMTSQGYFD